MIKPTSTHTTHVLLPAHMNPDSMRVTRYLIKEDCHKGCSMNGAVRSHFWCGIELDYHVSCGPSNRRLAARCGWAGVQLFTVRKPSAGSELDRLSSPRCQSAR
uniref:Uncharacterized protein n=1 Tax=Schistocephalus solidus TaxID=70667 RepID=A0A0X3PCR9_SCHSO